MKKLVYCVMAFLVIHSGALFAGKNQCEFTHLKQASNSQVREEIYQQYSHLTKQFLDQKIDEVKSSFFFFRSFVSDFYVSIAQKYFLKKNRLKHLNKIVALAVGDAHLENFGVVIGNDGKPVFVMNDPDDSGIVPVYLDFVRLLSSSYLFNGEFTSLNFNSFYDAYMKGLKGEKREYSSKIKKILKKALKHGRTPKNDEYENYKFLLSEIDEQIERLNINEIKDFQKFIEEDFGLEIIVHDSLKYLNLTGGSGGLYRYRFLIELDSFKAKEWRVEPIQIMEFKVIGPSGSEHIADQVLPSVFRINETLHLEQFEDNIFFGGAKIKKQSFFFRPRWEGNKKVKLRKIKEKDLAGVVADEFYTLGKIHQNALKARYNEYIGAIEKVGPKELDKLAKLSTKLTQERFEVTRPK